jgi:hypothetical protein
MMTSLDDFLNQEGKELPKEKQIPQSSLKLPKGAMSIFIDKNNEAVYRYDLNCYINSNEEAITSLIYLLRLKEYLENAFLVENSKVKPTYISKAYDDDIFVIVKADIEQTIEKRIKFEGLDVKIAVYPNKYIDVKDLSDYEPKIPNEIVEEAMNKKDVCILCGIPLEHKYYYTLRKPINEGAIVCLGCVDILPSDDNDVKITFEKTEEKQEPIIETNEEQEEDKEEQIENEEVEEKEDEKQETIIQAKPKGIIRIYFANGREYIEHLKLLKTINDDAWFILSRDSLQYGQLDPSHISAIFVKFFKAEIENFKECKFGIYLDDFIKIISNEDLKQMNNKDLTFEVDLENKKARILSSIDIEGDITLEEEYNEYSDFPEPKAILNAEAEVDLVNLLNAIKGFDTAKIILEKGERLFIEARKESIKKKTFIPSKIAKGGNEESIYDMNFLSNFLKGAIRLKKIAKLRFSNKMPLNIKFETSIAEISYWLAPRVEEQ